MRKIINWTAKRAGGRITINGTDAETNQPTKVVAVDAITCNGGNPVAIDKNDETYELITQQARNG